MLINPIFCIPIYMLYTAEKVKAVFYSKHRGVFRSEQVCVAGLANTQASHRPPPN